MVGRAFAFELIFTDGGTTVSRTITSLRVVRMRETSARLILFLPLFAGAKNRSSKLGRGVVMVEIIQALECIGCGRLEGPRPCIGVCQDQIVDLVYASDYKDALAQAELARKRAELMESVIRQLAWTRPSSGEWERSFRTLQDRARTALRSAPAVKAEAASS